MAELLNEINQTNMLNDSDVDSVKKSINYPALKIKWSNNKS